MRVAVYCDSSVVVTMPRGVTENIVEKFLIEKSDWLLKKINFFNQIKDSYISKLTKEDYLKNKEKAFLVISERVEFLNRVYNFKFNKISIKNQKTRWGSCSRRGNLNFNYKILFLPDNLRDYIIVHELCHLGEFNHSRNFWNLVAQTFPNFKEIKNELKTVGGFVK
ncbi:M48 family metallopeptidase [Patescibacteria group bacterium]|nr:M48 family metallopeptidase [Patescibacteria group bacterium]